MGVVLVSPCAVGGWLFGVKVTKSDHVYTTQRDLAPLGPLCVFQRIPFCCCVDLP